MNSIKGERLKKIVLPNYTKNEELFNMSSHAIGIVLGLVILVMTLIKASFSGDVLAIASSLIYSFSVIILYTMSTLYHGLSKGLSKKVFRILDHSAVSILIAGTYTPIILLGIKEVNNLLGWSMFIALFALMILNITLNAIDIKKFRYVTMIIYLVMGWSIIGSIGQAFNVLGIAGFVLILIGGVFYTGGAILYGVGKKKKYFHSIFHICCILATLFHFIGIYNFILK